MNIWTPFLGPKLAQHNVKVSPGVLAKVGFHMYAFGGASTLVYGAYVHKALSKVFPQCAPSTRHHSCQYSQALVAVACPHHPHASEEEPRTRWRGLSILKRVVPHLGYTYIYIHILIYTYVYIYSIYT